MSSAWSTTERLAANDNELAREMHDIERIVWVTTGNSNSICQNWNQIVRDSQLVSESCVVSYRKLPLMTFGRKRTAFFLNWYDNLYFHRDPLVRYPSIASLGVFKRICRKRGDSVIGIRHNETPVDSALLKLDRASQVAAVDRFYTVSFDRVLRIGGGAANADSLTHAPYLEIGRTSRASDANGAILFVGRLSRYKAMSEFISQWNHELTLRIIGVCADKPYAEELRRAAHGRNVRLELRYRSAEDISRIADECQAMIVPYQLSHNLSSGTVHYGLSLGLKVWMPECTRSQQIQAQIGKEAVLLYSHVSDIRRLATYPKNELQQRYRQQAVIGVTRDLTRLLTKIISR